MSLGASLVSHPNILKVHHNDCPFQRQLRQRGAQVVALAAAATAVSITRRSAAHRLATAALHYELRLQRFYSEI